MNKTSSYIKYYLRNACVTVLILSLIAVPVFAQTNPKANNEDVEKRVDSILKQLTLEEKITLIGGVDGFYVPGIPRLNLPRLKMADGPMGVRNFGPATAMAGGVGLAATWNPALAERVGVELGRDARAKGVNFLLAPGVNIYRGPMNGRNFEYFGEDPLLASRIAVGYIKGVQSQGVSATVKHFMGNNSEFDRHNTDSIIDERTMREIYLPVFEAAVKEAHVGAVMDSYNFTNGLHMTQNGYLNTDVLKKEWGFDGIVMSDWTSTYDAIAAANGGLDLEMPSPRFMNKANLMPAIDAGKVSVATIDDKVRRILRKAVQFGWLDRDQTDLSISRFNQQGRQVALQAAREGMVLLKNQSNLLPLSKSKVKSIAVIGPDAYPAQPVGGGSARVAPFNAVSFLEGMSNYLGANVPTTYNRGLPTLSEYVAATAFTTAASNGQPGLKADYFSTADFSGTPTSSKTEARVDFAPGGGFGFAGPGVAASPADQWLSVRWTAFYTPKTDGAYDIFVQGSREDARYRLLVDDKVVLDASQHATALVDYNTVSLTAGPHKVVLEHSRSRGQGPARLRLGIIAPDGGVDPDAKKIAAKADYAVLTVGFEPETEAEGGDRTFRLPPGQERLIQEIAAANKNTIVVVTSGGGVDMTSWVDRVPVVLQSWYPGQEGGTAATEVLFGDVNPSGRLPVTFEKRWEDNPAFGNYYPEPGTNKINYREGVFIGYRGYEHSNKEPLFPFGYGLSYTTFKYSNLTITDKSAGGSPRYEITFEVKNTGTRAGDDVAQVYVGDSHAKVARPAKELKGFSKVSLKPGESKKVTVILDGRSLSYYDVNGKHWQADPGDFDISVGRSSTQIELRGKITLAAAASGAPTPSNPK